MMAMVVVAMFAVAMMVVNDGDGCGDEGEGSRGW